MDTPERRVWGERRPKDRVTLQIILVLTFTRPKSFTQGGVSVFDKYLHWPLCKCKSKNIYIYTLQHDKCKCKKIECVSVNDLQVIYMAIDTYMHNTSDNQCELDRCIIFISNTYLDD
jgi:hypothetical protein